MGAGAPERSIGPEALTSRRERQRLTSGALPPGLKLEVGAVCGLRRPLLTLRDRSSGDGDPRAREHFLLCGRGFLTGHTATAATGGPGHSHGGLGRAGTEF